MGLGSGLEFSAAAESEIPTFQLGTPLHHFGEEIRILRHAKTKGLLVLCHQADWFRRE
jgi:hypothetical protein